jgi:hypothetical protein
MLSICAGGTFAENLLPPILFFPNVMMSGTSGSSSVSELLGMTICFFFGLFSPEAFFSSFLFHFFPVLGVSTYLDLCALAFFVEIGMLKRTPSSLSAFSSPATICVVVFSPRN